MTARRSRASSAAQALPPGLVRLRGGDESRPLFVLGGTGGEPEELLPLARRLATGRGVLAVQAWGSAAEGVLPTVEAMAERGVKAIRALQPSGPYHLVGYSFGGLVAVEIARRLKALGETVELLGLIDVVFDRRFWPISIFALSQARITARRLAELQGAPLGSAAREAANRVSRLVARLASRAGARRSRTAPSGAAPTVKAGCEAAMSLYRPRPYPGRLTLMSSQAGRDFGCDPKVLWRSLADEIEALEAPGDHLGIVRRPESLARLAELIDDRLARGLGGSDGIGPDRRGDAPVVLLATTTRWLVSARQALALAEAGFSVETVCARGHPLERMDCVRAVYRFDALNPLASLRRAIERSRPDIIVPGDDRAAAQLRALCLSLHAGEPRSEQLRDLLVNSLGAPERFANYSSREAAMALAVEMGVRRPDTRAAASVAEFQRRLDELGLPAVLKTDGSWGGEGVAIVRDRADAVRAFRRLRRPTSPVKALKRCLFGGDANLLVPSLLRIRPTVSVQRFIAGKPGNVAVACWRGEVLSVFCAEAVRTKGALGHATVVRVLDHPEMIDTVKRVVGRLELSGLCGFDFMLDEAGGAWLIEINPRATPTCHFAACDGAEATSALRARVQGRPVPLGAPTPAGEVIALFPQEMLRDPESGFLRSARHDVPVGSPAFLNLAFTDLNKRGALTRARPVRSSVKPARKAIV